MTPGGMDKLGAKTARDTDVQLADEELKLLARTTIDWKRFRPQIADKATYDALEAEVGAATAANESLAQLKFRVQALGKGAAAVVRQVLAIAAPRGT